ncbi:hypothetical protein PM082_012658 [Marasmius tenuissimus]|nr:hypothetical protein PM082_012658 [Marasmius tenuissimus]
MPLSEVEVDDATDIDKIIDRAAEEKAIANQVRAMLIRPASPKAMDRGCRPMVIALLPTNGKDDADLIHQLHLKFLKMATQLDMPVVSMSADGATTELLAQTMLDRVITQLPHVAYNHDRYGIHLRAPVFPRTGPLVSVTDPLHSGKTARNQPQAAGLVIRDVENVDKQDDGAARRVLHGMALEAATIVENGSLRIREGWEGLFIYLLIFGTLYEAWINPTLSAVDRIIAAAHARFFLHHWRAHVADLAKKYPDLCSVNRNFISPQSFNIFNRLCDTLILLAYIYSIHYSNHPFCPWLLGTDMVKYFFGVARQLLPNFTFTEFLKIVQHVMVRQRILMTGKFDPQKREWTSAVGYIADFETSRLINHHDIPPSKVTIANINSCLDIAYNESVIIWGDILHI